MILFTPTVSGGRYLLEADTRAAAVAQIRADREAGLLLADDALALACQLQARENKMLGQRVTPQNCAATCATLDLGDDDAEAWREALDAAERREQDEARGKRHAGRKWWQIWSKR